MKTPQTNVPTGEFPPSRESDSQPDKRFAFLDTIAKVDETNGTAMVLAKDGETYYVICSKGYVLSINLRTQEVRQTLYPERHHDEAPFAALGSSGGLFYTGAGKMFMEYDPAAGAFTYYSKDWPNELYMAFRMAEAADGRILISSYPTCRLLAFDPKARQMTDYGRMDDVERYISYIVEDAQGWIYLGIGSERRNMVAFNPKTGERRQLLAESERARGCGYFHKGQDGQVYGHVQEELYPYTGSFEWKRFLGGEGVPVAESEVSPLASCYGGYGYSWGVNSPGTNPKLIKKLNLGAHELVYTHPETGREISLRLEYFSYGADLGRMFAGPDGRLYGTTNHPAHFYIYDPASRKATNYGGFRNINCYASQGPIIGGASYPGGYIIRIDTRRPITPYPKPGENPKVLGQHEEVYRPRSSAAHPDGKRMVFGGFAGYGAVGGGLCVYNAQTGERTVILNEELVPTQSTVCMRFLKNGDLLCANSIETPGGAKPKTTEAELFRLDLDRRKLVYRAVPIPGAREISVFELDNAGLVHGITSNSIYSSSSNTRFVGIANAVYFVFDPETRKTLYSRKLEENGLPRLGGMLRDADGMIYGIMCRAIYRIDPEKRAFEILAVPPVEISTGLAIIDRVLYFGSFADLWSYELPAPGVPAAAAAAGR